MQIPWNKGLKNIYSKTTLMRMSQVKKVNQLP